MKKIEFWNLETNLYFKQNNQQLFKGGIFLTKNDILLIWSINHIWHTVRICVHISLLIEILVVCDRLWHIGIYVVYWLCPMMQAVFIYLQCSRRIVDRHVCLIRPERCYRCRGHFGEPLVVRVPWANRHSNF